MSEANINAYQADVDEAEKAVAAAQSTLDAAKQRLADKKVELGLVDESSEEGELVVMDEEDIDPVLDHGVIGVADPTHTQEPTTAPELPQAGDVVEPEGDGNES